MSNRTVILWIAAAMAIVVGLAASFFELTVLGVLAAIVCVALAVRRRPTQETPGR
jgi:membrane protein implicated in regulation of membrane protease activity